MKKFSKFSWFELEVMKNSPEDSSLGGASRGSQAAGCVSPDREEVAFPAACPCIFSMCFFKFLPFAKTFPHKRQP